MSICEEQFGFVKGKSTTDVIFALRQLQERYREGQQDLHSVFIDLGKNYARCMRDNGYQSSEEHVTSMRKCSEVCCRNK